jgi:hypothetical protein
MTGGERGRTVCKIIQQSCNVLLYKYNKQYVKQTSTILSLRKCVHISRLTWADFLCCTTEEISNSQFDAAWLSPGQVLRPSYDYSEATKVLNGQFRTTFS